MTLNNILITLGNIINLPTIIVFIALALFLTIKLKFINFLLIPKAIKAIFGQKEIGSGSISPITAFLTQLGGDLGIGSISGAAIALHFGGPGVIIWMIIFSFFFSIIKFTEISVGHKYRTVRSDGTFYGGPFFYIKEIIKSFGLKRTAIVCGGIVSLMTIVGMVSASAFQITQMSSSFGIKDLRISTGISIATVALGLFIIFGGVKRLGKIAIFAVPIMALSYFSLCIITICANSQNIINALGQVLDGALKPSSLGYGMSAVILTSMQRMIFASEAGTGTAAIMHAPSTNKISVNEGLCAIFDCPIISIMLSIGAFAIVVSGVDYKNLYGIAAVVDSLKTAGMHLEYAIVPIVLIFGFTTIVTNWYYAEQSFAFLSQKKYLLFSLFYALSLILLTFAKKEIPLMMFDISSIFVLLINLPVLALVSSEVRSELRKFKIISN